ncbi:DUF2945 domain-containing protein [Luteimonas deserti]|uniref:DUF2945 domain-containing protein n=1 Tax=Luteimonas deserti TaxID=2752306 RepID=A0A7Z0QUE5_9GAMM|nr:DUF2945 domain-containing protein [Luteimonas deserti]NYZ63220.1 DUF2945 domain-containing protein [Luteimonas deserti]
MATRLRKGSHVEWETSQGKTRGKVERKLTSDTTIKGHHVAASPESPQYLVVSDKTGAKAAHRADALKRVDGSS